jgi:mRNA interferase MazF
MSPKAYHAKSGLMLVCPITSQAKGYPFEVAFKTKMVQGVILADQIRGVDWKERKAKKAAIVPDDVLSEARELVQKLLME